MKLKIKTIRPQLIFSILLAAIIMFESYWLYTKVYTALSVEPEEVPNETIVRLDIGSFNRTIEHLDDLRNFTAPSWGLFNTNPFR